MKKAFVILGISVVTVAAILLLWNYFNSPKYALNKVRQSFNEHDYTTFQKYADVESIAANVFDVFLLQKADKDMKGFGDMMKPKLTEMMKIKIKNLIENPHFNDKSNDNNKFENLLSDKNSITEISETKQDGKIAYINLKIFLDKIDTTLLLTAKMRDVGENWQLFGFENLNAFLETINTLQLQKLEKFNKDVRDKIKIALGLEREEFTISKTTANQIYVTVKMDFKNNSTKNIINYNTDIDIFDKNKNLTSTLSCKFNWEPNEFKPNSLSSKSLQFILDPNSYSQQNMATALKTDGYSQRIKDLLLVFADGDKLQYLTNKK